MQARSIYTQENPIIDIFSNIGNYLVDQALEKTQLVLMGPNPGGNLSEKEIQDGMRPPQPEIVQTNPYAQQMLNSIGFGMSPGQANNTMLIVGGLIFVGALVVFLRK